ncbi:MAG: glycine oxidase ThiO [Phycisphaerae bacterium]|nr:glycine oxidase ThiO [Phycisphaerae bacterium]
MKSPDVLIVGGGVIGLSCALRLAQRGRRVRVLERGECGRESSWAGAGIIEYGSLARIDPLAQLRRASCELYPAFIAEIQAASGVDPEFDREGTIDLITDANQDKAAEREVAALRSRFADRGPLIERLTHGALRRVAPAISDSFDDALWLRADVTVRNPRIMRALRGACEAVGVEIVEQSPVLRFLREGERVVGLQLADRVELASQYLVSGGSWSSQLDPAFETLLPVHPVRGQIILLEERRQLLKHVVRHGRMYLVPRRDGRMLLGSTEEHDAGFEKRTTLGAAARLMPIAERVVPSLRDATIVTTWAGLRPGSKDGKPYLGPIPGFGGAWAATGHYRSGLTLAPITAELLAAALTGGTPRFDLAPFAPGRRFGAPNEGDTGEVEAAFPSETGSR